MDIYTIKKVLRSYKKHDFEMEFKLHTMWALFGGQTVLDIFNIELNLLTTFYSRFEYYGYLENAPKNHYSSNEVRLANIMTLLTHVVES